MRRIKALIGVGALGLALMAPALAQPGPGGRLAPEERKALFETLATELGLSEEQKVEVMAAQRAFRSEMRALREEGLTREEMRSEMMVLRSLHDEALRGILTEEQYARLGEWQEKQRQQRGEGGGQGRGRRGQDEGG